MPNATIGELGTSVTTAATNIVYRPVYKHWFYTKISETKSIWTPFTFNDSMRLEEAYLAGGNSYLELFLSRKSTQKRTDFAAPNIVTTDGGRCDVNIAERKRTAVYWKCEETEVRRCSWFYKGKDSRYKPYDEVVAEQLEEEYRDASNTGEWQRKIPLTTGETVVFHGPSTMVHFLQSQSPDSWTQTAVSSSAIAARVQITDFFSYSRSNPEGQYVRGQSNVALMNSALTTANPNKSIICCSWCTALGQLVISNSERFKKSSMSSVRIHCNWCNRTIAIRATKAKLAVSRFCPFRGTANCIPRIRASTRN